MGELDSRQALLLVMLASSRQASIKCACAVGVGRPAPLTSSPRQSQSPTAAPHASSTASHFPASSPVPLYILPPPQAGLLALQIVASRAGDEVGADRQDRALGPVRKLQEGGGARQGGVAVRPKL